MGKKILVVSSNKPGLEIAVRELQQLGYEPTVVESYAEAVAAMDQRSFDRIVSDLLITESSGDCVGLVGQELLDNLKSVKIDAEMAQPFNNAYAPLGLRILGLAFARGMPVVVVSPIDPRSRELAFIRYAILGKSGIFIERFIMKADSTEDGWRAIEQNFEHQAREARRLLYVDLESRQQIFGV